MTFAALQGLRNQKMNFMTFQDPWEPWFAVYRQSSKHSYNEDHGVCMQASLDEPTQSVVMHRTEPSRLQSLALQLAEKMANLVDQNERTLEVKTSGLGYFNYQRPGS